MLSDALENWPVDPIHGTESGPSRDSIHLVIKEVGERRARVALEIGGEELIADPRNKKHIDYAPFIEYNGSPAGRGQFTLLNAWVDNDPQMRREIHEEVSRLVTGLTA
jgi:hypothetical protein